MTSPVPRDRELLSEASLALGEAVERSGLETCADTRLRLLEGAAAHVGGYALKLFDEAVGVLVGPRSPVAEDVSHLSWRVAEAVQDSPLPPSLALAALGDSEIEPMVRRRQGRYFTDSRLALRLASGVREEVTAAGSVLDPACGAGVLLVAAVLQVAGNAERRTHLVRRVLWGVDRDVHAVRAARAAIASLTGDVDAIASLCQRLLVTDSLTAGRVWWGERAPEGFDLVIANPPWEKLRVTRHEHALGHGHQRHYGDEYRDAEVDEEALQVDRSVNADYRRRVTAELAHQGRGESDLYKMFLELGGTLTSPSGAIAFLVPAGFVRNSGARELREWLFGDFDTDIVILDNRERYFAIDSRFKFVELLGRRRSSGESTIRFGTADAEGYGNPLRVKTSLPELRRIQRDLTLPEVKSVDDWELFTRIAHSHPRFGDLEAGWHPRFHREVDMTNDRSNFEQEPLSRDALPLIEGRMVHHHRVAAKRYVAGRGRQAEWSAQPPFQALLRPQWFIQRSALRPRVRERVGQTRAGFCDITGQTNERTVLAALIPAGVVCGNKVPTLDLASYLHAQAWVGIANSFIFDWLARRLATTTLNFFIVRDLPIPRWDDSAGGFVAVAESTEALSNLECVDGSGGLWDVARLRARIEALSASLYGVTVADLDHMLGDFPQVDGAQPPIPGEAMSTVTRDFIVASGDGWATQHQVKRASERVDLAKSHGAVPFLPNEHARMYGSEL